MTLNKVTLVCDLYDGAGNPVVQGTGTLVPTTVLTDSSDQVIAGLTPVPVPFRAGGLPQVSLLATDNSGLLPSGWAWTFTPPAATGIAAFNVPLAAGPFSFTATNASPCVFSAPGYAAGYVNGTAVTLAGGSLPAGFSAATTYYVVAASGTTFELAATPGGAAIGSTSSGSGTVQTTAVHLSALSPVSSAASMQAYLPLPSGTPSAGQVPVATGTGEASAWGTPGTPLTTLGDTIYGGAGGAETRLPGNTSATREFLRQQGTGSASAAPAWDTIQAGDLPAATSGAQGAVQLAGDLGNTAAAPEVLSTHLASPLPVNQGGTGQATQQAAINALSGTQSAGKYLRSDGTNAALAAIQAADLPAATGSAQGVVELAGDLGGTAASPQVTGTHLASALPVAQGGTGQVTAAAAYNALSPMTALGDIEYESGAGTASRLAGNTSATKNFLTQTGTGSASAAPAWGTIASGDLPTGTTSAKGALQLDGTASDIAAPAVAAAAGSTGKAADAGHVHPLQDPLQIGVAINFFPGALQISQSVFTASSGAYSKLISGGYPISNLNIFVGASSGNISVAAYTNSGTGMSAAPTGGRLATSGAIACPAGGNAAVSLGSSITPNLGDWVALSADNTTATFQRPDTTGSSATLLLPGWGSRQLSAHPLPSTPSSLSSDASIGNFMMRGS